MKTEIAQQEKVEKTIDWNKPQWFINLDKSIIVFSTGLHEGEIFEATAIPYGGYPYGCAKTYHWSKNLFIPIQGVLHLKISND